MNNKKTILLTIILLVLVVLDIAIYANRILSPSLHNKSIEQQYQNYLQEQKAAKEAEKQDNVVSDEELADEQLKNLKSMGEQDRMYTYVHTFVSDIESGDYSAAYALLYPDFKQQYFSTQQKFEEYVKKIYPQFIKLTYDSIERQGEYYIVTVRIFNEIDANQNAVQEKFVVHEKDFNDFEISFQVL